MSLRRLLTGVLLAAAAAPAAAQTGSAPYVGYNFTGRTSASTGYYPPDTMGAVGVNQFTQFLNGTTAVYNKDGTQTLAVSDTTFWNTTVGLGGGALAPAGDSRVLYDPVNQRWVATAFTGQNTNNSILLARTDGPDALGPWKGTSFQTNTGFFADFPMLGMNADGLVVATNNFSNVFQNLSVYNLPKTDLYAATPSVTNLTRFESQSSNVTGFAPHPVTSYDPTQTGTEYLLSRFNSTIIRKVSVTGAAAAGAALNNLGNYTTTAVSVQPNSPQPGGTSVLLETGDTRHSSSPVRVGDRLFVTSGTAATVNSSTVAGIRFTVLNATNTSVIYQQTLAASGVFFSYPSVGVNAAGDVVIGFTTILPGPLPAGYPTGVPAASAAVIIGAETSPGVWQFRTNAAGDPVPTLLANGSGGYTLDRWGDYSATTPDPADPGVFWTTQEYSNQTGNTGTRWATQVSEVIVPKAAEARWQPGAGGTRGYATAGNWYAGTAPAATDHVIFSRWTSAANSQTVTTSANTTADRLSVRQTGAGTLTLSLALGTTFTATNPGTATPSLAVAEYQGQARLTVTGGGTLSTQTAVVAGTTGATGVLTIDGAGTTWANAGGAYIGGTASAAGGQGTLALTNGATANLAGPLVVYNAPSAALQNVVTVGTAGASAALSAAGLANTGTQNTLPAVTLANVGSTLTLNPTGASTFTGVIGGPGSLTVSGTGTQRLGGANAYTGATSVTAGTLALQGSGSIAASPTVSLAAGATVDATLLGSGASYGTPAAKLAVAAGQTLTGSGTVSGGLTAAAGSTVSPVGTLTVTAGSAVLQTGSTLSVRVTDASTPSATPGGSTVGTLPAPTSNGFLNVSGAGNGLTVGSNLAVVIDGTGTAFTQFSPYSYTVAQATAGTAVGGGYTFAAVGFQLDPASTSLTTDGSLVYLNFTPVPEPGTVLLVAAGGLGAWRLRRRR